LAKRLAPNQIRKIIELSKAGISIAKIAESLKINKTSVYYHARKYCQKMTKLDLNLLNDSEKGYIIGVFLGDGSFNKGRKTPRYIVRFAFDAKRDQEIAKNLFQIFGKANKKVSIFPRENTLVVKVCSKELVKYIQSYISYRINLNNQREKSFSAVKNLPHSFQYGVLAGIIDSDGHVHRHLGTEIKTVSTSIFQGILNLLNNLGITAKIKHRKAIESSYSTKDFYVIYLPSHQMRKHQSSIPSVKVTRLARM